MYSSVRVRVRVVMLVEMTVSARSVIVRLFLLGKLDFFVRGDVPAVRVAVAVRGSVSVIVPAVKVRVHGRPHGLLGRQIRRR